MIPKCKFCTSISKKMNLIFIYILIFLINQAAPLFSKLIVKIVQNEIFCVDWKFKISLMQGDYNIVTVLSFPDRQNSDTIQFCDYVPCAVQFQVQPKTPRLYGYVHWANDIDIFKL